MKRFMILGVICLSTLSSAAFGQQEKEPSKRDLTPQQAQMKTCQADATTSGKKGKERQEMVNACLADGKKRQQEKMKSCNAEASGKKGDERKKFMALCLKK